MKYRYFISLPHQEVHFRFIKSILGGKYVYHQCGINETKFNANISEEDGEDTLWFFTELTFTLHPLLKGKQVFIQHGLRFGGWVNPVTWNSPFRIWCINNYIDMVFQVGLPNENDYLRHGVNPQKMRPIGYTTLFEIPELHVKPNAVLFSSTYYRNWHHYYNLANILKRLDPEIDGYLTIHPETT